jgi:hypothetical protein
MSSIFHLIARKNIVLALAPMGTTYPCGMMRNVDQVPYSIRLWRLTQNDTSALDLKNYLVFDTKISQQLIFLESYLLVEVMNGE